MNWFLVFSIALIVQLVFYAVVFLPLRFRASKNTRSHSKPTDYYALSLVIIVKNETNNLRHLLPLLLTQEYPATWDIHLIDDHSHDSLEELLSQLPDSGVSIHLHRLSNKDHGKKAAMQYLQSLKTHPLLLFTDADCRPASNAWMKRMANPLILNQKKAYDMVLGYSPYLMTNTTLNKLIHLETQYTALMYLGLAHSLLPYMGVGRNILYKKSVFERSTHWTKYPTLLSGDDDLTVNELSARHKAAISLDPGTFVYSIPKSTWTAWLHQKTRHVQSSVQYRLIHQLLLLVYYGSYLMCWFFFLLGVFIHVPWFYAAVLSLSMFYGFYWLVVSRTLTNALNPINWLIANLLYVVTLLYLGAFGFIKKVDRW